ncbi:MAG: AAA family ATPase [Cyanobacteria bacterium J06633_2]
MSTESTSAFSDNWAYLRTELSWLDRMLMMAVARYRQDKRNVDHVAQNHADQASSHWWKGIVSMDGNGAYDEHRKATKPAGTSAKVSYNQQLDARIKASQAKGTVLALPVLRDRLSLTTFEKNAVLIGLAPEVNRRYARLYRYLQGQTETSVSDLPSIELILRLLCRNDNEWRVARQTVAQQSSLLHNGLMTLLQQPYDTMLTASLKLSEPLVRYLLAETPTLSDLDTLLHQSDSTTWAPSISSFSLGPSASNGQAIAIPDGGILETKAPRSQIKSQSTTFSEAVKEEQGEQIAQPPSEAPIPYLFSSPLESVEQPSTPWNDLILPEDLKADIQHICHRVHYQFAQAGVNEDIAEQGHPALPTQQPFKGTIALFSGQPGTGKSLAAEAIATDLNMALHRIDLSAVPADDHAALLIDLESVPIVLLESAQYWLSSAAHVTLHSDSLRQFLFRRRSTGILTVFTVHHIESIAPQWFDSVDYALQFPIPHAPLRQQLWEQAFRHAGNIKLSKSLDLTILRSLTLSGGEIWRAVEDSAIAASVRQTAITIEDIQQALRRQGKLRALRQLSHALAQSKKTSKKASGRSRRKSSTKSSSTRNRE